MKASVSALKVDVSALKVDVSALKVDVNDVKVDVSALKASVGDFKVAATGVSFAAALAYYDNRQQMDARDQEMKVRNLKIDEMMERLQNSTDARFKENDKNVATMFQITTSVSIAGIIVSLFTLFSK